MDKDQILSSLRAGETSRELSAAICVDAGYVPGVPGAKGVNFSDYDHGGIDPEWLWYEAEDRTQQCAKTPDLLLDANACMAFERAMKGAFLISVMEEKQHWNVTMTIMNDENTVLLLEYEFAAPTELAARVGAVLMARAARER